MKQEKQILFLRFLGDGPPREWRTRVSKTPFRIIEHSIAWNFDVARHLIEDWDGVADGIVLSGLTPPGRILKEEFFHKPSQSIINLVRSSHCYTGDYIETFFENWTLNRILKNNPSFFKGRRVLFHAAMFSGVLGQISAEAASVAAADPLVSARLPLLLRGVKNMRKYLIASRPFLSRAPLALIDPFAVAKKGYNHDSHSKHVFIADRLKAWIKAHDVFVTWEGMLHQLDSFEPLRGKTLVIDRLRGIYRDKAEQAGVGDVIEFMPREGISSELADQPFSLLGAIMDQVRISEDSDSTFDEYALKMLERFKVKPNPVQRITDSTMRFGFVIHPLAAGDMLRAAHLRWLAKVPKKVKDAAVTALSYSPPVRFGTIKGIRSTLNGKEVECRLYALAATPRRMLAMDVETTYGLIARAIEMAERDGCRMVGLGAYTKVIGDSGVTVARRASLPVTNGNSYSAAATVMSALETVEKVRQVTGHVGYPLKVVVIGASGSIGRACSLVLAPYCQEIVIIAPRPEKVLDVRDEISTQNPNVKVSVALKADSVIGDADIIVTATSNQVGNVFDIMQVKPGAVVCDCSRPLDVSPERARERPDVIVIESGEIDLPGDLKFDCDIGLPYPSVYACLAETAVLCLENRYECFSLGRELSTSRIVEIQALGEKHGAKLSAIRGPLGLITDETIARVAELVQEGLKADNTKVGKGSV